MRFRGVAQVVVFNWPKVVGGLSTIMVGGVAWRRLPLLARLVVLGSAVWTPLSVLASWWVYDLSPLRQWRFVTDALPRDPTRVLVVVAGFDEVSPTLRTVWPQAELDVVDVVVDPEASVRRARRWYPAAAPVVAPADLAGGATYDLVIFAQSAHEIRDREPREAMFAAARDAVGDGGRVVLVEHLRDPVNLVAFGPGALHFTTRRTWLATFAAAGLAVVHHRTVTPLVHVFTLTSQMLSDTPPQPAKT